MDEKEIKELFRGRRNPSVRRRRRCPDEMQLGAYVDRHLEGSPREFVEAHVAECDFCLSQVSFLVQAFDSTDSAEVPNQVLRRAQDLVPPGSERKTLWNWRWAAASVAAACLVLLVTFVALRFRQPQPVNAPSGPLVAQQQQPEIISVPQITPAISHSDHPPVAQTPKSANPDAPTLRGGQGLLPTVVFPRNGATLRRSELDFRWQPFADTVFYDVRVVTAEGDLVLETKTEDTHLRIGDDPRLVPGGKYFVSVRAHLSQGETVKSNIVSFRISEQ